MLDFLEPAAAWRDQAACVGDDTERFFPAGSTGAEAAAHIAEAKAVCAGCKVSQQCLDYALTTGQHDGIWGGLTEDERRSLRRKLQRRAHVRANR
ncbi:MAG: WhiB family transcriptional regulator [Egibacteraceae bacterium]